MRGACCAIMILILLPIGQCALSSPFVAAGPEGATHLVLSEVLPHFPWEHIGITNLGEVEVDLEGWSLSDGEGSWAFKKGVKLGPGQAAFVGANLTFLALLHGASVLLDPAVDTIRKGRLTLADEGDEVILVDFAGAIADVVAYGKSSYSDEGWHGPKCAAPSEGKVLARGLDDDAPDSDSSDDWSILTPGRSQLPPTGSLATVETFLCPEDMRARIVRELSHAQWTVEAAVYILSDQQVAGALADAARRGITVRVLVEGSPVGGTTETQGRVLQTLCRAGCEVRQLQGFHGFKRYDYLHCKYLVVDARRVLVASENWAYDSLENNRGWGACAEGKEVAMAFLAAFERDFDLRYPDVRRVLADASEEALELPAPLLEPDAPAPSSTRAWVDVVLAPEGSYDALLGLVQGAQRRLLLELFYLSDGWPAGRDLFQAIADAARRGASVRLILDGSWYNNDGSKANKVMAAKLNAIAVAEGLDLRAKVVSPYHPFATLHNKGAVADEVSMVCSINWVRASLEENREAGLVMRSPDIAGFFAEAFEDDWVDDSEPPVLSVLPYLEARQGEEVVLNATCSDNSGSARVLWDLGADGSLEGEGPFLALELPAGEHFVKVTALDPSNNSCSTLVRVLVTAPTCSSDLTLPAGAGVVAAMVLWCLRKRVKRA